MSLLEGRGVGRSVDGVAILRDIDFAVDAGEVVGLIGPNGAGKSSLLRLLAGIGSPDRGRITLAGEDLSRLAGARRARSIGYLPQEARAHWPFSVEKVVGLGRLPYQRWWGRASVDDGRLVEQALRQTETLAYRNRVVTTLSGGEQTLVMLARLFATEPRVLLTDEPVAALDPYHQIHVMELLRRAGDGGRAVVVVLHDLNLAARYCDRLYLLHHGWLDCEGRVEQVLTRDTLRRVYGIDCSIEAGADGLRVGGMTRAQERHP